jgi:hypothetical protein
MEGNISQSKTPVDSSRSLEFMQVLPFQDKNESPTKSLSSALIRKSSVKDPNNEKIKPVPRNQEEGK